MKNIQIEATWKPLLSSELQSQYMQDLSKFLRTEIKKGKTIYPQGKEIFNAFWKTSFPNTKVVILGQDPYHGPKQAHGLSFSVRDPIKMPPSLQNVFKELNNDLNISPPKTGNLEKWARQGVLLLNSCLTVEKGKPGSHRGKGWESFTDFVLKTISINKKNVVFILWGNYAREKTKLINKSDHLIIESAHPSPFSAHYGFFGSKPFSKTNIYLTRNGLDPISW
ncbi:MAG: uracil-DNA glycosylase [Paracoccaceae bacterium]